MSIPTFGGAAILEEGGRELWGDRGSRFFADTLPGVNGTYVQTQGYGGQMMRLTGWLTAASHTAIVARYFAVSSKENDVGTYVGCGGRETTNMLLRSVRQASRYMKQVDDTYRVQVNFEFVWLSPF